MKAVLAAVAAVGVSADYAASSDLPTKARSPIVKSGEKLCFGIKSADSTNDKWDKDCNMKKVAGTPTENTTFYEVTDSCVMRYTSATAPGGLGMNWGKLDDDCCQAMSSMFVAGAQSFYGQYTGGWTGTLCQSEGTGMGCAAKGDKTTYPYHNKHAVNSRTWYTDDATHLEVPIAVLPDEKTFNAHSKIAFGNNAACYNKAMGYAAANVGVGGNALMGALFGLYGNVRKTSDFRMTGGRGNALVTPANGPMCFKMGGPYGVEKTCDASEGEIKVEGPQCIYRSFVNSTVGQVLFSFGGDVGKETKCCESLITLTVVANARNYEQGIIDGKNQGAPNVCDSYVEEPYMFMGALAMPQAKLSCMQEGGNSTKPFWTADASKHTAKDGVYMNPSGLTSAATGKNAFPSEAAYDEAAKHVAGAKKDGACLANAKAFTAGAGKAQFLNAVVGGALAVIDPMIAPYTTTTTTTTTTIRAAPAETSAPTSGATKQVEASFTATEDLPATVTGAELLASTAYKTAKQTGISKALGLSPSDITITGFTVSRRELQGVRSLASKTVVTQFTVKAADDSAATTLKNALAASDFGIVLQTEVNKAFAATDFSSDAVISSAPSATVATVAAPTVGDAPAPAAAASGAVTISAAGAVAVSAGALLF